MFLVLLAASLGTSEDQSKEKIKLIDYIGRKNIFRPYKETPPAKIDNPKPKPVKKKVTVEKKFSYFVRGFAIEKKECYVWVEKEESGEFRRLKKGEILFSVTILNVSLDQVTISEGESKKTTKIGDKIVDEIIKEEKWIEEDSGG